MPIEEAGDRAAMIADWGVPVTYTPAGGALLALTAIADAGFLEPAERLGTGVAARGLAITMQSADLPAGAGYGDTVVLESISYRVTEIHPDGTGISHVFLEHL